MLLLSRNRTLPFSFVILSGLVGYFPAEVEEAARGVDRRAEAEIRAGLGGPQAEASGERGHDERAALRTWKSPSLVRGSTPKCLSPKDSGRQVKLSACGLEWAPRTDSTSPRSRRSGCIGVPTRGEAVGVRRRRSADRRRSS